MGLPMLDVFECLSLENIVTIMAAVMLERQVLITSSQLSLLTAAAEVLTRFGLPPRVWNAGEFVFTCCRCFCCACAVLLYAPVSTPSVSRIL